MQLPSSELTPEDDVKKIKALIEEWAKDGFEELFKSNEIRDPCLELLTGMGCKAPVNHLVYSILSKSIIYVKELASDYWLGKSFEWACKWAVFRQLVEALNTLIGKCQEKNQLRRLIVESLRDSQANIDMEATELMELDVLSVLRNQQNFENLAAMLGTQTDVLTDIQADIKALPSLLNAPILRDPTKGQGTYLSNDRGFGNLYFGESFDPYVGREADYHFLVDFLYCKPTPLEPVLPFAWQLIYGDGGAGKSRLALQLLQRQQPGWRGGFVVVDEHFKKANFTLWRPTADTLFIIDYAATDTDAVGRFLDALQQSSSDFKGWHVRVLLIERTANSEWLDRVTAKGAGDVLKHLQFQTPRLITPLDDDDLCRFMIARMARRNHAINVTPEQLIAKLGEIDALKRPLFAAILAEALIDGQAIETLKRDTLLGETLKRERDKHWLNPEERHDPRLSLDYLRHAHLLALTTMVKSLPLQAFYDLEAADINALALPHPDRFDSAPFDLDRFQRMTHISGTDQIFEALQPDLLGELFTLQILANETGQDRAKISQPLIDKAWDISPLEMAQFLVRCAQDYPERVSRLNYLCPNPEDEAARTWFAIAQIDMIQGRNTIDFERGVQARVRKLQTAYPDDAFVREQAAKGAFNLMNIEANAGNLSAARDLLVYLRDLQTAYPDDVAVREQAAKGAFHLIVHESNAGNLSAAHDLLAYVRDLQTAYQDDAGVRERAAQGAVNLMIDEEHAGNLSAARDLLAYVHDLQKAFPDDAEVRESAARGAFILMYYEVNAGKLSAARDLLACVRDLQTAYPDDAEVRERAAQGAFNLMIVEGKAGNLSAARDLLAYVCGLQTAYPDNAEVRELAAMGAVNLILYKGKAGNLTAARDLLAYVRRLQTAYPEDAEVREQAAKGAVILIFHEGDAGNLSETRDLLAYLRDLETAYPDDAAVREMAAQGAEFLGL